MLDKVKKQQKQLLESQNKFTKKPQKKEKETFKLKSEW